MEGWQKGFSVAVDEGLGAPSGQCSDGLDAAAFNQDIGWNSIEFHLLDKNAHGRIVIWLAAPETAFVLMK
jgi:hypothetical protein